MHCVKSVQIRIFFWSAFSHLRTEYGEISECGKIRTRKNSVFRHFSRSDTLLLEFKFFYFLFVCRFSYVKGSLNITAHLSIKIIQVHPNLVCTFFGNILLSCARLKIIIFWCALNQDIYSSLSNFHKLTLTNLKIGFIKSTNRPTDHQPTDHLPLTHRPTDPQTHRPSNHI